MDYFSDSDSSEAPASTATVNAKPGEPDGDEGAAQSTLIPKSVCPGRELAVGDEIVLRVVANREGQYEVAEAQSGEGEEAGEPAHTEPDGDEGGAPTEASGIME